MDWIKFGRAKLKEIELQRVDTLENNLFNEKDNDKVMEAIQYLSSRQEWKDFLKTLKKNLEKEFEAI